ncbi:MAG: DUF4294 domain-containing protein [Bacteroidia bacterium]
MNKDFFTYSFKYSKIFALAIISITSFSLEAQTNTQDFTVPPKVGYRCRAEIVNGDTIPTFDLNTIYVYTNYVFKNQRQYELWTRTKYNVKKVYPYAILAAAKLKEYDKAMEKMTDENLKKAFLKVCEKDLRHEFEDELKELTISQGKVLMKLIDRETGKTTYEVVKQLRGSFQAVMWQTLARLFGNTMKVEYDANVEDIMIERAIKLVESGQF